MITFRKYIKQLCMFALSSSLALGLIVSAYFLVIGEFSVNGNLDLDFGRFDGFWLMLGLPVFLVLLFAILSPLSFLIHRILSKKSSKSAPDTWRKLT